MSLSQQVRVTSTFDTLTILNSYNSYSSSGSLSGSLKKVNRLPVNSSTLIGSVTTPLMLRCRTAASKSLTENARCLNPCASGVEGLGGGCGKENNSII